MLLSHFVYVVCYVYFNKDQSIRSIIILQKYDEHWLLLGLLVFVRWGS